MIDILPINLAAEPGHRINAVARDLIARLAERDAEIAKLRQEVDRLRRALAAAEGREDRATWRSYESGEGHLD